MKRNLREQVAQPPDDSIRYIALTKGQVAIVDAADYEELNKHLWRASAYSSSNPLRYRAVRMTGGRRQPTMVYMHRVILNAPAGLEVDHINGDGLDNRHCLRPWA